MTIIDKTAAVEVARINYPGPIFNPHRFEEDFAALMTTRKMISRFLNVGVINERLVINNIVTALNIWGPMVTETIFRHLCQSDQFGVVKSVLIFLQQNPNQHKVESNRMMDDILAAVSIRYNIQR